MSVVALRGGGEGGDGWEVGSSQWGSKGLRRKKEEGQRGSWVGRGLEGRLRCQSQPVLLSVLDAPDGLDLGTLAVGAPVPPVLVVPAVFLTLHDILLAPVAGVLVAHKAVGVGRDCSEVNWL